MDGAEDAEIGSGTSSTTRSAKNSSASVDMADDAEVGEGDGGDDEMVKRSPSKKLNVPIGYLISLRSNADSASFAKRWVFLDSFDYGWGSQLEALPKWLQAKFAGTTNWTFIKSRDLRAFLIPFYIDYQSTTFGHQYSFEWHFLLEPDFSTKFSVKYMPSHNYVNAGTRSKPRLQSGPKTFSLSSLPLYSPSLLLSYQVGKTHSFPQLRWFCDTFLNQANRQRLLPNLRTY